MATETTARVLEALSSLYNSNGRQESREANRWLESFQKKPEAWGVADFLLKSKDSNLETRLFAAQTFKQKITYDLRDLDSNARFQLRDSLMELLWQSSTGPKAVTVQLCLALADLAIQLLQWKTVIPDLVEKFEKSPVCLLELLKILPEEMNGNTRLALTDAEYKSRGAELIDSNAQQVLQLLNMYMQNSGSDVELQERVFTCFSSWIRSGEMDIQMISASPLLELSFKGLDSPELFDVAVDVVCEIIYETRDVNECQEVIQKIYPCFTPMIVKLAEAIEEEDDDTVRGYCRILVGAGEAYTNLIGGHPEAFTVLMDGILKCSSYNADLTIVQLTFKFWYELSNLLQTETFAHVIPQFTKYYDALVDIIIVHLHYPSDLVETSAEERDEFRDFRHEMGDTIKDCCRILTPQRCLLKPMNLLTTLLNKPGATWQEIEAPIFSLRVMGSEVPEDEDQVMPHIMEFLSRLPDQPKIRYAATLVISRYSFWTKFHPQYITYQLNFISSGFQNAEVAAASALALKNLCKDCSEHLVDYISQLHVFYLEVVKTLPYRDVLEVTEAVSHVITVIPVTEIEKALQLFCLPVAQSLHAIASKGGEATQEERVKIGDILEQISVFFNVIQPEVALGQPHPCVTFISELWPVLDLTLNNFGDEPTVTEPLCKCFNNFILSYGLHFVPLLPQLMERLVSAFGATGQSCYLWVSYRLVREYAQDEGDAAVPCLQLVQRLSQFMFVKIGPNVSEIPDVVEEYFRMMTAYVDKAPRLLLQDPLLATVFQAGIVGLSVTEPHALGAILTFYRRLLDLSKNGGSNNSSTNPAAVLALYKEFGGQLTSVLFNGLVDFYHQDSVADVAALLKTLAEILPSESAQWMLNTVNAVPEEYMSVDIKSEFMTNWTGAIRESHWVKVRRVLSDFVAAYRRRNTNKDRR